jgi:hypothetical protein
MHQCSRTSALMLDASTPEGTHSALMTGYGYGLTWSVDAKGRVLVGHSGGLPGFGSNWRILPDYGIGVVAVANRTYASAGVANTEVLNLLIRELQLEPRTIPVSEILGRRQKDLVVFLPDWDQTALASEVFAENFFKDQDIELRRRTASELFAKAGRVLRVGPMRPLNNLRGTFVLECSDGAIEVWFSLTPENPARIQALRLKLISPEARDPADR